jgi:hypothetical protein
MTEEINEIKSQKIAQGAEQYRKKYRKHMNLLDESLISKIRPITEYDYFNLGKQLSMFEEYRDMCEADGTLSQLGTIPNVALDVLTVNYGTSPITAVSSVNY